MALRIAAASCSSKASSPKSFRAVDDFSRGVEDYHSGEGSDGQEAVQAIGEDHIYFRLFDGEVGRYEGLILIAIGAEKLNGAIVLKFHANMFEQRSQRAARPAPGGPEIQHQNFSFELL